MAKVVTSKLCFHGGKRYREGEILEYTGAKKDMPSYFEVVKSEKKESSKD